MNASRGRFTRLSAIGYRVPGTGNAKRQDYATTVVMYRTGYAAEGRFGPIARFVLGVPAPAVVGVTTAPPPQQASTALLA